MAAAKAWSCHCRLAGFRSGRRSAALNAYFDTSAVVKLILAEDDSDLADELWAASELRVSSHLIYPEARAALAAAARAERIDIRGLGRAVRDLEAALSAVSLVGVDAALAREAGGLADRYALRGYDAVHLATALSSRDPDLLVITWDRDLADAALACGHRVAPAV